MYNYIIIHTAYILRYNKFHSILVAELSQEPRGDNPHAERAKPHCTECGNPMKGYKNVADCPRNIRNQQQ